MAIIIDMPKLSDTMTTGTLVRWLKKERDAISSGDMIAQIETDKATMELENFEEGVLLKQYVKEGDQVSIGAPIAAVGEKGERAPVARIETLESNPKEEKKPIQDKRNIEPNKEKEEKGASEKDTSESAPTFSQAEQSPKYAITNGRMKASPLARKIARDRGIILESIEGSGPSGRIVKADVLSAAKGGGFSVGRPTIGMADGILPGKEEYLQVSNMRQVIARRLVESKTQVPHFYLDIEVDAEPMLKFRSDLNKHLADNSGTKLTVNDFILKATTIALCQVSEVNSSWQESVIKRYGSVHISFGVAIDDGLVTPVIRDAHAKSLIQLSSEAKELINKARNKKLTPNEMTGSTFTVTNLGMFGINNFYGIINPPNAGILSVGATVAKPVVDKSGSLVVGQRMTIGFSGDHRVIDGVAGAQFLQALKAALEGPSIMLV